MSDPWTARPPAHRGLEPALPAVGPPVPAAGRLEQELLRSTGGTALRRLATASGDHYVVEAARPLFAKVVPAVLGPVVAEVDALARELAASGVATPLLEPGFPRELSGRLLLAYPFLSGRYAWAEPADLRRLGAELAGFHRAAARTAAAGRSAPLAAARTATLLARLALLERGEGPLGPQPARAVAAVRRWGEACRALSASGQLLHGDLNVGNVLYVEDRPVLLDLEEACRTRLPVLCDVGAVLERFVLVRVEDDDAVLGLAAALVEGYGRPVPAPAPLSAALATNALRALATLAELAARDEAVLTSEWEKFLGLLDAVEARRRLLARLDALLAPS